MRKVTLAVVAGSALAIAAAPAQAAWKNYVNKEIGFTFTAPAEMKASVGTFRGAVSGPRESITYRSDEDNIEYRATVMQFPQAQAESATLLGEREYMFQDGKGKKTLTDVFTRVGSGPDAIYGRKLVVDLPDNKGRATGVFYFTKGKLITLEAIVTPAHGKLDASEATRFVDSIAFNPSRAEPGAVVLETPALE
jgi:hypothetical protein